jgi:hypothetical protein
MPGPRRDAGLSKKCHLCQAHDEGEKKGEKNLGKKAGSRDHPRPSNCRVKEENVLSYVPISQRK